MYKIAVASANSALIKTETFLLISVHESTLAH
jgi:hypothetical protein